MQLKVQPNLQRPLRALRTPPTLRGWFESLLALLLFAALALPLGFWSGLLRLESAALSPLPLVLRVFFAPGLTEEVIFRVLPPRFAGFALAAYVLAHPLNAWLFFPAARSVFYHPVFLLLTALLGGLCTLLYRRTGSLWSPVVLHTLVVSGWLLRLGGAAALSRAGA